MKKVSESFTFSLIGYGRLGKTLSKHLQLIGGECKYVISRHPLSLSAFKTGTNSILISQIKEVDWLGQYCFICVPDDRISDIANILESCNLNSKNTDFIHTSGAMSSSELMVLQNNGSRIAAFHPMQTFTGNDESDVFQNVLLSLEGDRSLTQELSKVASHMGCKPLVVNEQDKMRLHIAGVMVSNFIFSLVIEAAKVVQPIDDSPEEFIREVYGPLIEKTVENIVKYGVHKSMTGPASRGDIQSVEAHKRLLELNGLNKPLYEIMTASIVDYIENMKLK